MSSDTTSGEVIFLDGETLKLEDIIVVARNFQRVELTEQAKEKMIRSRRLIEQWVAEKKIIYGITTGFGSLQNEIIASLEAWPR